MCFYFGYISLQVVSTKVGGIPEVLPEDMIYLSDPTVPSLINSKFLTNSMFVIKSAFKVFSVQSLICKMGKPFVHINVIAEYESTITGLMLLQEQKKCIIVPLIVMRRH